MSSWTNLSRWGWGVTVLSTLSLLGCGETDRAGEGPAWEVRDSAGTRRVTFDPDELPGRWAVAAEPTWKIGSPAGMDFPLHEVSDVRFTEDGRVLIVEQSSQSILVVDPEEEEVSRLGGEGTGPGEFSRLYAVFETDEGVTALDRGLRRKSLLGWDGSVLRTEPLPSVDGTLSVLTQSGEGELFGAAVSRFPEMSATDSYRESVPVLRLESTIDTMTMTPGIEAFRNERGFGGVPFGATSRIAGSAEGVWVGDTAVPEIALWREPETPAAIVRWRGEGGEVTEEGRARLYEAQMDLLEIPEEQRSEVRRSLEGIPSPSVIPAFGKFFVGLQNELWIWANVAQEEVLLPDNAVEQDWYVIIEVLGETAVSRVKTPTGFNAFHADGRFVVGVHKDELGVETVRGYELLQRDE